MAHVAKYTRGALGHMFAHYERAKGKDNEYIKFGNENIDTSKSHLNYNLGPKRNISQGDFVKKRCNEVKCLNRKDVNVMCSWVITAPKDLDLKQQKKFFIESNTKNEEEMTNLKNSLLKVTSFLRVDMEPIMLFQLMFI